MRVRGVIAIVERRPVDRVVGKGQRQRDRRRAGEPHRGNIAVVGGLEHDHFVARMRKRLDRREYRLRRAGGDGDFALGVVGMAVEARHLGGDGFAQCA